MAVAMLFLCLTAVASEPVKVIVDTDMGNDIDDALAFDLLYKAMDQGTIEVLGISNHKKTPGASPYIDILNTFYGYPSIPISRSTTPVEVYEGSDYTMAVAANPAFQRSKNDSDFGDPVKMYRRLLAESPDTSVVVISLGFGTDLAKVLKSGADEFSPLSGRDLVAKKAKYLSIMAGSYGEKKRAEFNVINDIPAMQTVFRLWPRPIYQNPFELGVMAQYPGQAIEQCFFWTDAHPVAEGYRHYKKMPYNRATWDLLSVMFVTNPEMFGMGDPGTVTVDDKGFTNFKPDPQGQHRVLTLTGKQAQTVRDYIIFTTIRPPKAQKLRCSRANTMGLDKFSDTNIFSRNTSLPVRTAIQGFDFDPDGSIWYTQCDREKLYFIKSRRNPGTEILTSADDYMILSGFGHGTNCAVEAEGADRYLWSGCFSSCNEKGAYWGCPLVGRVKYSPRANVGTHQCDDYYYIGDFSEEHPSIDPENDLLTINYHDKNNPDYRCFVIYRLSEAKKAPLRNVTVNCTDGFSTGDYSSTKVTSTTVRAHDLTKLVPVARPQFLKRGFGGDGATYYDWQGYYVCKDRLYYSDGQSNYNLSHSFHDGKPSYAYITVFDFDGRIIEPRHIVAGVADRDAMKKAGISVHGTLEPEGIKVRDGKLYLGFTARGITENDKRYFHNILVFDESTK